MSLPSEAAKGIDPKDVNPEVFQVIANLSAAERKTFPVATGVIDYFPDALVAIAQVSRVGNDQHNPGKPLHWDRSKSGDEADALMRHFLERGTRGTDGLRHSAKVAWRALALLQKELEADIEPPRLHRNLDGDFEECNCDPTGF